jgi:hypothetical protein
MRSSASPYKRHLHGKLDRARQQRDKRPYYRDTSILSYLPARPRERERYLDRETRKSKNKKALPEEIDPECGDENAGGEGGNDSDDEVKYEYTSDDDGTDPLRIRKIKSSKDKIKNPPLAEQNIIPRLGTSTIMCGTTGQGKSTLLANLLRNKNMLGGHDVFDLKFLVSPTAQGDDVQKELKIKKRDTFSNLDEAPAYLKVIMRSQRKKVTQLGSAEAPQTLLIYDDVISHPLFMKTDEFTKSFIASRHYNMTTFICSQAWTAVPRKCRLQAKNIFFFAGPLSEVELLAIEYCPPGMSKKQFAALVEYCTKEPYSFLYINKSAGMEERYRKNLNEQINLDYFRSMQIQGKSTRKGKSEMKNQERVGELSGENTPANSLLSKTESSQDQSSTCPTSVGTTQ